MSLPSAFTRERNNVKRKGIFRPRSVVMEDDTETNIKSVADVVDIREASVPSDTIEDNIIETDIVSAGDTEEVEDTTDPAVF